GLTMVEDLVRVLSDVVLALQFGHRVGPPLEFGLGQTDRKTTRLAQSGIDAALAFQLVREPRPEGGGGLGPVRVFRLAEPLPLHPYEAEIGACGPERHIAFVQDDDTQSRAGEP